MKINILFYLIISLACSSCREYPPEPKYIATITNESKTNVIGIVGDKSEKPYIEIIYSVANGNSNKTERMLVSPPYLFKTDKVNIRYDSIVTVQRDKELSYMLNLKHDYTKGGAEYFQIINHSPDKTIEYFVVGAQDLILDTEGYPEILPSLMYKNAPLYYLLFPEEKPDKNVEFGGNTIYFEGNRCGDIELTGAWTIDGISKIFRAEYKQSRDTLMCLDIMHYYGGERLYNLVYTDKKSRVFGKKFYGTIPPQDTLKADKDFWLLATPWMFDETIKYERL